jgi:hypothetical protein
MCEDEVNDKDEGEVCYDRLTMQTNHFVGNLIGEPTQSSRSTIFDEISILGPHHRLVV